MGSAVCTRVLRSLRLSLPLLAASAVVMAVPTANAATSPGLGMASTFSILSSTYTNTVAGTTISGDLGYTIPPALFPTVNGTIFHPPDSTYTQAGIDQGTALTALAIQPCTFTFANGAIDLATDTTHGAIGVYTPGVYCTGSSSAASIGTAGITLTGSGTYIFRIHGALTTVANSAVRVANGACAGDAFWTPDAATTLGANSTFLGTDIDASGITIGSTVTWTGRALAFGGTVSTDADTINTVAGCSALTPAAPAAPAVPAGPRFTG
jgi:Ice-binding-like